MRKLDAQNQTRYYTGSTASKLTKPQMYLLAESILSRAFSRYELFLEEAFILYCQGKPGVSGRPVGAYLAPRDAAHARDLIKSGMTFLEWNSPDNVIGRSSVYLHPGNPIHSAITANRTKLTYIRKIRNAIAHASLEAQIQLRSVVQNELGVLPPKMPTPGEFLIMNDRTSLNPQYYLLSYLDVLERAATVAAG